MPLCAQSLQTDGDARIGGLGGNGTQMVVTDDDGNLGTQAIPSGGGGSSPWGANLSDIFYDQGQVGIGLTDPDATLHLLRSFGNSLNEPILRIENNSNQTFGAKTGLSIFTSIDGQTGRNGIQNVTAQTSTADDIFHGIINNGFPGGSGVSYGIKNLLTKSNTPTGQMFGISNTVNSHPASSELVYGLFNDVTKEGSGRHTGLYNILRGAATSDTALVSVHPATGGFAGKFIGNVEITDQLGIGIAPQTDIELQVDGDIRAEFMGVSRAGSPTSTNGFFVSGPYNTGIDVFTQSSQPFQSIYGVDSRPEGTSNNMTIYGVYALARFSLGSSTAYGVYADKQSGGNGYALYVNGEAFKTGNGVWTASDERLKTDVRPLQNALALVNALEPAQYQFKQNGKFALLNLPAEPQFGFIAQDVEAVAPDLVKETDIQFREAVRDGHTEGGFSERYKALNYQMLIPVLTQGMKEQQAELMALRQKNEELEEAMRAMRNDLADLQARMERKTSEEEQKAGVWLHQNTPNPFGADTRIAFQLPKQIQSATLIITAPNGQLLQQYPLTNRGEGVITVRAGSLSAGLYYYSLMVDGQLIDTRSMLITQ